jgi:hypothetical protein
MVVDKGLLLWLVIPDMVEVILVLSALTVPPLPSLAPSARAAGVVVSCPKV